MDWLNGRRWPVSKRRCRSAAVLIGGGFFLAGTMNGSPAFSSRA
jgi:hypothetical protein